MKSSIEISREWSLQFLFRDFTLFLDSKSIGKIPIRKNVFFKVEPGNHTIYYTVDSLQTKKLKSKMINFHIVQGEKKKFRIYFDAVFGLKTLMGMLLPLHSERVLQIEKVS